MDNSVMFRNVVMCLFIVGGAASWQAQTAITHDTASNPGSSEGQSAEAAIVKAAVPPTEAVITVPGICDSQVSARSKPCTTVVTREQFENLWDGLSQSGQALRKDQTAALAKAYADFIAYAAAARKAGIEDNPQFREYIRYQQLRMLAGLYRHVLEEKYKSPPPEDVLHYYEEHRGDFEEISLRRLLIPKNDLGAKDRDEYKKRALQLAQDMQERASKGEDLEDLQKEAYKTLGLTISPPTTQVGKRRRATLVAEEATELFALKPGEASKLEAENSSYVVYRVDSKRTLPLDEVKNEIVQRLSKERFDSAVQAITESVHPELNPTYFVESPQPSASTVQKTQTTIQPQLK